MAMAPLRLDYQRANKPVPWLGMGLLLLSALTLGVLADRTLSLNRQIAVWDARIAQAERVLQPRQSASRALSEQEMRARMLEIKQANQVLHQLSQPWNALFSAVEGSGGKGIALLSMEPDLQKGTVNIGGEAKDLDTLLQYVRQLSSSAVFASVQLQHHQVRQEDPEKPLRFSLVAYWAAGLS
jgi:Tfp pilus assembly protein PilN